MTGLFIRFYLSVLAVLFVAWYIHVTVWKERGKTEWARIVDEWHGGGARLLANELDATSADDRDQVLSRIRERFVYPVDVIPVVQLPSSVQQDIARGDDVVFLQIDAYHVGVGAVLCTRTEVLRLGPFPEYDLKELEEAIGGWTQFTADKLNSTAVGERDAALRDLQNLFAFPIDIADRKDLPAWPQSRLAGGTKVALYPIEDDRWSRWSAVTPLADTNQVVRFGPLPNFEDFNRVTAATTFAFVLLPVALAIAILLKPVAWQLRQVENAATAIAAGNLSARVDETGLRSAKPLAQAFNHMAARTEILVGTQRELLQAVSHELRTPLSRMRFAIELIGAAKDDTEQAERLKSLDAATEELDELVAELLSYVRIETVEQQLNREQVAVREVLEILIPQQMTARPVIAFVMSENQTDEEEIVFADRSGFQRVLGNLLSNAGRFARSRVTIRTELTTYATIVNVDDDGDGIPESEWSRVLEPFVTLDDDSNECGVGLGLALVKRIVTRHNGSVDVLTSPDGGCRIRTTWPLPS